MNRPTFQGVVSTMRKLFLVGLAASLLTTRAFAANANPVTGIAATVHDGQTWITYTEPYTGSASANIRYLVYRATGGSCPIASTASATLVSTVFNNGGQFTDSKTANAPVYTPAYSYTQATRQDPSRRMSMTNAGGITTGGTPLAYGTGLAVYTAVGSASACYAVITHDTTAVLTDSPISAGSNSMAGTVAEVVAPIKPILQDLSTNASRFTNAPGTKITTGPGAYGCLREHGSGGGPFAWGDLAGLWGDSTMGYQDGIQSVFSVIQTTGCNTGGNVTTLALSPQDATWTSNGTGQIETYWTGSAINDAIVHPYTQARLLAYANWMVTFYGIDPNHLHYWGDSMGTIGGLTWAARVSPNPFDVILLASPFPHSFNGEISEVTSGTTAGSTANVFTCTPSTSNPYCVSNPNTLAFHMPDTSLFTGISGNVARGGYDDFITWSLSQPCSVYVPPIIWGTGRTDNSIKLSGSTLIGPMWSGQVDLINELKRCHRAFAVNWGNGNHGEALTDAAVVHTQYVETYAKNISYPAFFNFSLDGNPGDGTYVTTGGGSINNGDLTGCINCGWTWSGISDTTSAWSATITNSQITGSAATADITLRNAQNFKPVAGTSINWSTSIGGSGTVTVDSDGLITIPTVSIASGGINLTLVVNSGTGTPIPVGVWTAVGSGGYPETPVGYEASVIDNVHHAVCTWQNYKTRGLTSETQDAMMCFDFATNWSFIVSQGAGMHGAASAQGGHSVSNMYSLGGLVWWMTDGSWANQEESYGYGWVFDLAGLTVRETMLPTDTSNSGLLTRVWLNPTTTPLSGSVGDPVHNKVIHFPDYVARDFQSTVCNVVNGVMTTCQAANSAGAPPYLQSAASTYNPDDGKAYFYGGLWVVTTPPSRTNIQTIFAYDFVANSWTSYGPGGVVPTTCSGVDCVTGASGGSAPAGRNCSGLDYDTTNHVFVMVSGVSSTAGGCSATPPYFGDTWTFNPATANWTEICNSTTCGYTNQNPTHGRLSYLSTYNVHVLIEQRTGVTNPSSPWLFTLSGTTQNLGSVATSWPSVVGSMNRQTPSAPNNQGNAFDHMAIADGSNLLTAHAEAAKPSDTTTCGFPQVYLGSIDITGARTWFPGSTMSNDCNSWVWKDEPKSTTTRPYLGVLAGKKYVLHENHGFSPQAPTQVNTFISVYNPSTNTFGGRWGPLVPVSVTPSSWTIPGTGSKHVVITVVLPSIPSIMAVNDILTLNGGNVNDFATVQSINTGTNTITAWAYRTRAATAPVNSISDAFMIPCQQDAAVTAPCWDLSVGAKLRSYPMGMIASGGKLFITTQEQNTSAASGYRPHDLYMSVYDPATGFISKLGRMTFGGTGASINYTSNLAADSGGNIGQCWSENNLSLTTRVVALNRPQVYCKVWNGSTFQLLGAGSLNHSSSNHAFKPALIWAGTWYAAWSEQATASGPVLMYLMKYNSGTNTWADVTGSTINKNATTGLSNWPALATDGSGTIYVGWTEQSTVGQHAVAHIARVGTSTLTDLGSSLVHDPTNGSVHDLNVVWVNGVLWTYFGENTWGNASQSWQYQWDGTTWQTATSGTSAPQITTTTPLPSGTAGSPYSQTFTATGVPNPAWSSSGQPSGSTPINSTTGLFSWTSPVAGSYSFTVTASNGTLPNDTKTFQLIIASAGVAPTIQDSTPLPSGSSGTTYTHQFTASGTTPITWSSSGIPVGSSLTSGGLFTWSGPVAGSYTFTVTATNSVGSNGPITFALTVNSSGVAPTITSPSNFTCNQGSPCTINLSATGTPPPTWSVTGSLPLGMSLSDPVNGVISGTPTTAAVYTPTVTATNSTGSASLGLTITVQATLTLNAPIKIVEKLYPTTLGGSNIPGVTRTADPVTWGIPFPDDPTNGISTVGTLGICGSGYPAQFRPTQTWPSGRVKWALADTLADITANGTNTALTVCGGTGSSPGTLATDNGVNVSVNTGPMTFVVKRGNFNIFDLVVSGVNTLVQSGQSPGLVLTGPDPTATYPANVTCSSDGINHPGVASICNHEYKSSNDAASTLVIEENGPVKTVLRADGDLKDGSGVVYMHFTSRMTFFVGKTGVKVVTVLRNADLGSSNTFTTAFKGHRGWEERVTLAATGTMTYSIGNETATPTNGFLSTSADGVYLYSGMTTFMAKGGTVPPNDCPSVHDSTGYCVLATPDTGYRITNVATGTNIRTGSTTQWVKGWLDVSDASGRGVEIGHYQMSAFPGKSLKLLNGGTDVRVGMESAENSVAFYMPWPQYRGSETWFNFHVTAPLNLDGEFQKFQLPLVAHMDYSFYNNSKALLHILLNPVEEDGFFTSVANTGIAPVATNKFLVLKDSATQSTNSTYGLFSWLYRAWEAPGGGNQMDFSLGKVYTFLTRDLTGGLVDALHAYRHASWTGFPLNDGFLWRNQASSAVDSQNFPTATSANGATQVLGCGITSGSASITIPVGAPVHAGQMIFLSGSIPSGTYVVSVSGTSALISANATVTNGAAAPTFYSATRDWPATYEHVHTYGQDVACSTTGDPWICDGVAAPLNMYLKNPIVLPGTERGVGIYMEHLTHEGRFYRDSGNGALSTSLISQGQSLYAASVAPDVCVSGFPVGCTNSTNPRGVSRVRGMFYAGTTTINTGPGSSEPYCSSTPTSTRGSASFQNSELLEGLKEFREFAGPSWSKYGEALDLSSGISQWALSENYRDDLSGAWAPNITTLCVVPPGPPIPITTVFSGVGAIGTGGPCGNGYRHYVLMDVGANSCSEFYYPTRPEQTVWFPFIIQHQYTGTLSWLQKFKMALLRTAAAGATDEFGFYTIGQAIDRALRPGTVTLTNLTITGFTNNGGGSYTISWSAPVGGVSYMVKWGLQSIVDWIGYDAYNGGFIGDPVNTQNWFASTTPPNIPNPSAAGATESMTIATGPGNTGLTIANFAVKAYVDSSCTSGCGPGATGGVTIKTTFGGTAK